MRLTCIKATCRGGFVGVSERMIRGSLTIIYHSLVPAMAYCEMSCRTLVSCSPTVSQCIITFAVQRYVGAVGVI